MPISAPDYLSQGRLIVREAENSLRGLLAKAAEDGDYDAVAKITRWAKHFREIAEITKTEGSSDLGESADYPKFFRSNNKLITVGWSKKSNSEYEHKAPKKALDQLVSVLLEGSAEGKPMPVDEILPRLRAEDGSEYPDYYARSFLRWMRTLSLVTKQGNRGYSVNNRDNFEILVNSNWRRLTEKE